MRACGIDLSGRWTGTTAIALVEGGGGRPALAEVASRRARGAACDAWVLDTVAAAAPATVSLDAPLSLPHAVTCRDAGCARCLAGPSPPPYGSRGIDTRETWTALGFGQKEPMATAMLAAIAFRAIWLARAIEARAIEARAPARVVETWPTGVCRALERAAGRPPQPKATAWKRELLAGALDGLELVAAGGAEDDELDAVAAAYAAWCVATGRARAVAVEGAEDEGAIWLPRWAAPV